jgi:hypothetical protein
LKNRSLIWTIFIPIGLVLAGTLGYWLLERKYSLFDALYMTVITLTTVGYAEVHELSLVGRVGWFVGHSLREWHTDSRSESATFAVAGFL